MSTSIADLSIENSATLVGTAAGTPSTLTPDQANAAGSATSLPRSDHVHNVPSGTPTSQTPDQPNAAGAAASFAKSDHVHNIPTATAFGVGNANAQGTATTFSKSDHIHRMTASPATAGQIPKFDGTSWQAVDPSALLVSSNSSVFRFDEFLPTVPPLAGQFEVGELQWFYNVTGSGSTVTQDTTNIANNHPGLIKLTSGGASGRNASIQYGSSPAQMILGGGALNLEYDIFIPTLATVSNDYSIRVGMGDSTNADFTNGVYFEYTRATNTNWLMKTAAGGTRTSTATTTAVATGWVRLTIQINAAGTSATYLINGTSVGTVSTNLPTAATGFCAHIVTAAGGPNTYSIDYFWFNQVFTTPR